MYYIYKITNTVNNRVYIGQTNNPRLRWNKHKSVLKLHKVENPTLQEDYDIYGLDCFKFEIIAECSTRKQAIDLETFYIRKFGGIESDNVYNCQDNVTQNKLMIYRQNIKKIGSKRSDEFREKQRQFALSDGNGWRGKHHTEETRKRLSESHKGSKNSMYGKRGKDHPAYGSKRTQEQKEISRLANLGKRKYSKDFIEQLKKDYDKLGTYVAVGKLYNINPASVSNLIKYGTPAKPQKYK